MARLAKNGGVPDGLATQSHRLPWFAAPAILLVVVVVTPRIVLARALDLERFPLAPPDTSSPRATLESFMDSQLRAIEALNRGDDAAVVLAWFRRSDQCLDLRHVSPERLPEAGMEASLLLYETLARVELPSEAEIPDRAEAEREQLATWNVPQTEIALVRVEDGDRAGQFLFSAETVRRTLEFYEKIKHLPTRPGHQAGAYQAYVTMPPIAASYLRMSNLPAWAKFTVLRNPLWKWFAVVLLLGVGAWLTMIIYRWGRRWDERQAGGKGHWRIGRPVFAISLVVMPLGFAFILFEVIGIRFGVQAFLSKCLLVLAFAATVFAAWTLLEAIADAIISLRRMREKSVNAHLVKVLTRLLGVLVSVVIVLQAADYLGVALGPILAGLGIGGLAVALAVRPTLENIIGGLILFADRPVQVGDFCRYGDQVGTIEEIGLRSTRIRSLGRTLVSVPNAEFSQLQLDNFEKRDLILWQTTLELRRETTMQQLRCVLTEFRKLLISHPRVSSDPARVRFAGLGSYSLDLNVFVYMRTSDINEYYAILEDVLLRMGTILEQAGTGFAIPTRIQWDSDTGLDPLRARAAETQLDELRENGKLPFPDFDNEERAAFEDKLDYPPKGSPRYRPR